VGKHGTEHARAVPSITSAREPLSDDIARRNTRYMWQMSTRVVCFVGALVLDHWTRWALVAAAVVLPYVAVVLANAGRERPEEVRPTPVDAAALPAGATTASLAGAPGAAGGDGSGRTARTDDAPEEGSP